MQPEAGQEDSRHRARQKLAWGIDRGQRLWRWIEKGLGMVDHHLVRPESPQHPLDRLSANPGIIGVDIEDALQALRAGHCCVLPLEGDARFCLSVRQALIVFAQLRRCDQGAVPAVVRCENTVNLVRSSGVGTSAAGQPETPAAALPVAAEFGALLGGFFAGAARDLPLMQPLRAAMDIFREILALGAPAGDGAGQPQSGLPALLGDLIDSLGELLADDMDEGAGSDDSDAEAVDDDRDDSGAEDADGDRDDD